MIADYFILRIGSIDPATDHLLFESRFEGGNLRRVTQVNFTFNGFFSIFFRTHAYCFWSPQVGGKSKSLVIFGWSRFWIFRSLGYFTVAVWFSKNLKLESTILITDQKMTKTVDILIKCLELRGIVGLFFIITCLTMLLKSLAKITC